MRHRRLRRPARGGADPVEGLRRLEYRGYDSAGLATLTGDRAAPAQAGRPHRRPGRAACSEQPAPGCRRHQPHPLGHARPGHRRATPTRTSAATARSPSSTTASSRTTPPSSASSQDEGVVFHSDTDTEVIAQLIAQLPRRRPGRGRAARRCRCSRAPTAWPSSARAIPDLIVGARLGSPLVARHRRGRALPGQRPVGPGRPHRQGRLPAGPSARAS